MNLLKRLAVVCLILNLLEPCLAEAKRPNIVVIVGEDLGPELGCYGDKQAVTPNLDQLASQGARFTRGFTHAPVCAPSRSGFITGRYPTTIGSHHMRSKLISPPPMFTEYLRKAGYVIAWPGKGLGKTDFNFDVPAGAFDTTENWTEKMPKEPFFAFINFTDSHESRIRAEPADFAKATASLSPAERHDPSTLSVPPYHPDAPQVRRDLANYYDLVTVVDDKVGKVLKALEKAGVVENTVVVFFGDHGRGLPRSKRWVYDSGIHVPLIVRWPGTIKPGTVREDLVSFVDFAPTFLSLAGAKVPAEMQGQIFLGPKTAKPREYVYAARDRMDETYDRIRAVRSKDFKYIRNFHPGLPYAQIVSYGEHMPTMQVWRKWNAEGKLTGPQKLFFAPTKPREELYDVSKDPYEINNLADKPEYAATLKKMRKALDKWIEETHDLGAVSEEELIKRGLVRDVLGPYSERQRKPIE